MNRSAGCQFLLLSFCSKQANNRKTRGERLGLRVMTIFLSLQHPYAKLTNTREARCFSPSASGLPFFHPPLTLAELSRRCRVMTVAAASSAAMLVTA